MNVCPKCGKKSPSEMKFCLECGAVNKIEAPKKETCQCGTEIKPGMKFCMECGTPCKAAASQSSVQASPKPKKKLTRRPVFWIASAVGAFIILGVIGSLMDDDPAPPLTMQGAGDSDYTYYEPDWSADIGTELDGQGGYEDVWSDGFDGSDGDYDAWSDDFDGPADDYDYGYDGSGGPADDYGFGGPADDYDYGYDGFGGPVDDYDDWYNGPDYGAQIQLLSVSRPPDRYINCPDCDGTGHHSCIPCNGTGNNPSAGDASLFNMPGFSPGLGLGAMNAMCISCWGNKTTRCWRYCGDGKSFNPDYTVYGWALGELLYSTGMAMFEIEGGTGEYVGVDICAYCNGNVVVGNQICMSCAGGFHIFYPMTSLYDDWITPPSRWETLATTANNSGRPVIDYSYKPADFSLNGAPYGSPGHTFGKICQQSGCSLPQNPTYAPFCGKGAIPH